MRYFTMIFLATFAAPSWAQESKTQDKELHEKEIVVTGLADGARVVEVDFDKVWKNCAECKRALAKLDKLAQGYRDELGTAKMFVSGPADCGRSPQSKVITFQQSSADPIREGTAMGSRRDVQGELCQSRAIESTRATQRAMVERYVVPEQEMLLAHMRSFLDQLAPHVNEATEAERVLHKASAGLTDTKRTKLRAKRLQRIDVTQAVIARLDAKDFTIVLPDPPPPGPANGGYKPIRRN